MSDLEKDRGGAPDSAVQRRKEAKAALRVEMRRTRRAIPAEERDRRGRLITDALWSLPELQAAKVVFGFSSFGSEVPTDGLLASLHSAGVTVLLPFVDQRAMFVAEHGKDDPLVETAFGPREPLVRRPSRPERIDAVIVPGLAFDRGGGRLGYGGGYYDGFLRALPTRPALIAVTFSEQVVDAVPVGEDDVGVDLVVTELEVIRCRPRQADRDDAMNGGR